jgi:tetratricopeptide (TPR) repeat protein
VQLIGYTRRQKTLLLSAIVSLSVALSTADAALAIESWQSLKQRAEDFAIEQKFRQATDTFEQALKIVPADRENERVDIQLAAATSYNNMLEVDKAIVLLKDAGETIKRLKAQKKLDPQVLVSLKTLIDANERGYSSRVPYAQRAKLKMRMSEALTRICADVYPQANTTARKFGHARSYVANSDYLGAKKQLELILSTTRPSDPLYRQIKWSHAAVEHKLSKPQVLKTMMQTEMKEHSEQFVLIEVAMAQLWAADYDAAVQCLNKALDILKKKPDKGLTEFAYTVYIDIYKDKGDDKGAEPWLRKRLALVTPKDRTKYFQYSRALSHNLRKQRRYEEADAVMPERNKSRPGALTEWEWFLTDKEKADVKQADAAGMGRNISKPSGSSPSQSKVSESKPSEPPRAKK